jgi:acetylornithine deacetylase
MKIPPLREMCARLIATPSVSSTNPDLDCGNEAVAALLAEWFEALGFAVERMPVEPGKCNVVATAGRGAGGLVLAGHTDTVPYDAGRWRFDPLAATEHDGRLYGLGSSDMKGFLALALDALRDTDLRRLQAPLVLLATCDEETTMNGARALVAADRPRARHALIGEPTCMRPVHAHKGIFTTAIRIRGRSGHSSNPALGRSALDGMHRVICALIGLRSELAQAHIDPAFEVPAPTLNLGYIHGGDNPNRICAECELHIDFRTLPGMPLEGMQALVRERVAQALDGLGLELEIVPLCAGTDALGTPVTADIVRACAELTGHAPATAAFSTEAPFLSALGMDTVVLGPGDVAVAHQPDEYLDLAAMEPTRRVVRELVERFCMGVSAFRS